MSRRRKAVLLFLGLALFVGLTIASMVAKVRRGEDLLWISELWLPAAVLSIGVVTGIEFLMPPPKTTVPTPAAPLPSTPVAAAPPVPRVRRSPAKPKPKAPVKKTPKK